MPTLGDMINKNKMDYNSVVHFGKHSGKLITEILEEDPGYILWASENVSRFNPTAQVLAEARFLVEIDYDEDEDLVDYPKD